MTLPKENHTTLTAADKMSRSGGKYGMRPPPASDASDKLKRILKKHPAFLQLHDDDADEFHEKPYFALAQDCFLIKGAARHAVYDLSGGDVYSITAELGSIIEEAQHQNSLHKILQRASLSEANRIRRGLLFFVHMGIGTLSAMPQQVRQLIPESPRTSLRRLFLEITNGCNLRCIHCYAQSGPEKIRDRMLDKQDWQRLLTEAATLGCIQVTFAGGEPMLRRPDLFELIRYAREKGIREIELLTNGTIMEDDDASFLREYMVRVAVSFYAADQKTDAEITGNKRHNERVLRSLALLNRYGIKLRITMIVIDDSLQHAQATSQMLRNVVPDAEINYNFVFRTGRGKDASGIESFTLGEKTVSRLLVAPRFPKLDKETFFRRHAEHSCWGGGVCVSAQGRVTACPFDREQILGDVTAQSLEAIVTSAKTGNLWSLSKDRIEGCKDCEYRYVCFDCRPRALEDRAARGRIGGQGTGCGDCGGAIASEETELDGPARLYRKPSYCLYDPYSGVWLDDRSATAPVDSRGVEA